MEKEGNNLFQVNLKGMIALLSEHIYSNPNTFVRELLQNCVDAITALRNIDENYKGRIDVFLNEDKTVVFRDNGVGLKEEEVYRFLTVIGESSKRDTPDADDFIGRFGIGLLSCFVVTNEITVESRSAMGGQPVCWCGKVDGTYQLTLSDEERPIGSSSGFPVSGRRWCCIRKETGCIFLNMKRLRRYWSVMGKCCHILSICIIRGKRSW